MYSRVCGYLEERNEEKRGVRMREKREDED
jgi:hypothetical protein